MTLVLGHCYDQCKVSPITVIVNEERKMNTGTKTARMLQDGKIDVKIKLAALWVVLMFCYTYADILGFYAPGNLEELLAGEIAGIQMTQELLLGSAVLMAISNAIGIRFSEYPATPERILRAMESQGLAQK